ncbi:SRPBCC family protein [Halobacillus sp. Nhm2S1]|uniref:SRPBCC family protein n=1 Tax=Halobacillus sp. Nhm2S1 TaxID=2866716 RepID=UPI001C735325|nr:SRPBCC family protein [Halobacillus sp. Nhm2S1]
MPVIIHRTFIEAPAEVCFDLARNVDVHTQTTSNTKEKAVAGVTEGWMEEGDEVTWEAKHLGIRQRLTARITEMDRPHRFVDVMVKGAFHSFTHTHEFLEEAGGTMMVDTFAYQSPLGPLGLMADRLFLEKYMKSFIELRALELKKRAENKKDSELNSEP